MALADFYPLIKATHVGLALLSSAVFAVRGVGVLLGATAPMALPVRRLSQTIDTALLAAALLLLATLGLDPFATPWLRAKLAPLAAYIVFVSLALRRAPTRLGKTLAFVAALSCFMMMIAIARSHDPLGFFRTMTDVQGFCCSNDARSGPLGGPTADGEAIDSSIGGFDPGRVTHRPERLVLRTNCVAPARSGQNRERCVFV